MANEGPENQPKSAIDLVRDGAPDWEAIDFDILCSRCGYNLRTLVKPQCPECGFEFEWPALVQGYVGRNTILFEHVWRQRPIRGFFKSIRLPLFHPRSFWNRVSLHDRVEPGPLWALVLLGVAVFVATFQGVMLVVGLLTSAVFEFDILARPSRWGWMSASNFMPAEAIENIESFAWDTAAGPFTDFGEWCALPIGVLIAFLSVLVISASLHETIARFKLRRVHMLRVVAYVAGPVAILTATVLSGGPIMAGVLNAIPETQQSEFFDLGFPITFLATLCLPLILHLRSALRNYLGIPHATLAAFLFAIIALMTAIVGNMAFYSVMRII